MAIPAIAEEPPTRLEIEEIMGQRYGTTLSEPELPVATATRAAGLGYTAPSNLHHWVGFMSLGYSQAGAEPPGPPSEH